MTYPKIRVATVARGPSKKAEREVWLRIRQLFGEANLSRLHPERYPPGFPEAMQAAMASLRDGGDVLLSPRIFTQRAFDTFTHLRNIVASGQRHLRECRHCHGWFPANDKRRVICVDCQSTAAGIRWARWKKGDRDDDIFWKKDAGAL